MEVQEDISLQPYNTFGIEAKARYFCEIKSIDDLRTALRLDLHPRKFVISGGSNMLITQDIDALVLYMNIKGIEVMAEDEAQVTLKIMAGENWHQMVLWTLDQGYGGLENMSLIPGNTGTAPIQNIGAYGVELKDSFVSCEAMDVGNQELKTFSKEACRFGYRDSYFKNQGKGKYIITSVTLQLTKKDHKKNTSYGAIEAKLRELGVSDPTIKDISRAVIAIRREKLPDPSELGNSGSFFKNPIIDAGKFKQFAKDHPKAPFYKISDDAYKIPAGWLIEQCGFKGKRYGDAGIHKNQALVLVNYGKASGNEILELAKTIMEKVRQSFDIQIVPEVNIIK
ncbi:UDP-N-acetylmuramate dehydrogenase [Pseudozobellia thermophila]|uniref:UDP-N-acetylenolpyruvoylglucosamine reductase n=1 Tax=Pseudozobellia thermophila TaxID=192903 RepID=A0A1M6JWN8_9FLAO|nr:UDP-N-acetylmuramate dehydrogenase [Pseudozobellia thermophila]SHJ51112.1 UDP-N-acetylmuramate dehydrogenase [Pseudozobellia thermophila]